MKILIIGDPHGDLKKIRKIKLDEIDIILLTGDLGKADLARKISFENYKRRQKGLPEFELTKEQQIAIHMEIHNSTINVVKYLSRYAPVFSIQGNIGIPTKKEVQEARKKYKINLPSTMDEINSIDNFHMVKNQIRVMSRIKIGFLEYFTDVSWVREFKPKLYKKLLRVAVKQTNKSRKVLNQFAGRINILICHQPPYGILDKVNFPGVPDLWKEKHAGSRTVLDYIKKYSPKYVFCGHIHEGEGFKKIGKTKVYNLGVAGHKIVEI